MLISRANMPFPAVHRLSDVTSYALASDAAGTIAFTGFRARWNSPPSPSRSAECTTEIGIDYSGNDLTPVTPRNASSYGEW